MGSFEDQFEKQTTEFGIGKSSGSEFWKPVEGTNKIRLLSTPELFVSRYKFGVCYEGAEYCKKENLGPKENLSYKWLTWIIDRADGEQKLYSMPFSITKDLTALKTNDEYAFEDFPMPYDITLNVKNAGTKEVEYSVVPSRKETPLLRAEIDMYATQTPVPDVIAAMKEKARKQHGGASEEVAEDEPKNVDEIEPGEIPF
jgi:hypothetical protein